MATLTCKRDANYILTSYGEILISPLNQVLLLLKAIRTDVCSSHGVLNIFSKILLIPVGSPVSVRFPMCETSSKLTCHVSGDIWWKVGALKTTKMATLAEQISLLANPAPTFQDSDEIDDGKLISCKDVDEISVTDHSNLELWIVFLLLRKSTWGIFSELVNYRSRSH